MIGISISFSRADVKRIEKALDPARTKRALSKALTEIALRVARDAAENQIIRGGRFRGAGGALVDSPPDPRRLTSRTGRLRDSIAGQGFRRGIDDSKLPDEISVGSNVVYAPVHELGGRFVHARPFLRPALEAVAPLMSDILARHWQREIEP